MGLSAFFLYSMQKVVVVTQSVNYLMKGADSHLHLALQRELCLSAFTGDMLCCYRSLCVDVVLSVQQPTGGCVVTVDQLSGGRGSVCTMDGSG